MQNTSLCKMESQQSRLEISFWKKFSSIEDIISNIDCTVVTYHILEQHIIIAATKAIQQKNPSKGRPSAPWWDQTCKSLLKIALKYYEELCKQN